MRLLLFLLVAVLSLMRSLNAQERPFQLGGKFFVTRQPAVHAALLTEVRLRSQIGLEIAPNIRSGGGPYRYELPIAARFYTQPSARAVRPFADLGWSFNWNGGSRDRGYVGSGPLAGAGLRIVRGRVAWVPHVRFAVFQNRGAWSTYTDFMVGLQF